MRRHRSVFALVAGLGLVLTACGGAEGPSLAAEKTPVTASTPGVTTPARGEYIAQATVPMLEVYSAPDAPSPSSEFENPWYYATDTQKKFPINSVFFSDEQKPGWVKVLLPVRPNGSEAWVRAADMVFRPIDLRVVIDVGDRKLHLYRGMRKLRSFPVAVGEPETPTPLGRFAVAEVIPTGDPKAFLGPIVMPLTAFSNVLNEYAGGNGRVAIHGTSKPELIGTAASHGCIRMRNADIQRLTRLVRGGTPVIIRN